MMTTVSQDERRDALVGRALQSVQGAADLFAIYLGRRLGYYQSLWKAGAATSAELASRTGTNERYAREWLEQQAASSFLDVDDARKAPDKRRFTLPEGHAAVLADSEDLNYVAPIAAAMVAAMKMSDELAEAFRSGAGVSWSQFGPEMREAQGAQNKALFLKQLAQDFIPAILDVHARLLADPPARVADIACGFGWSSIGMAKGYPNIRVDGYDLDAPSIEQAKANAREHGVADRVRFEARDAGDPKLAGQYDLVTMFEALHDMSRLFYGFSLLVCLPDGMSHTPSAATGTVMRPATLRGYAREAGFKDIEALAIEAGFFRFYRLVV